jgi:hypothetical protein
VFGGGRVEQVKSQKAKVKSEGVGQVRPVVFARYGLVDGLVGWGRLVSGKKCGLVDERW